VTLAGQYDLGVVKVGLGLQNHSYTLGSSADTALSFAVPVGAFSFGGIVGTHKIDDGVTSKTANGWGVQASYALSKRTSVYGLTRSVDYTAGDANKTTRSQVGISHSF
jgi:predicted porin